MNDADSAENIARLNFLGSIEDDTQDGERISYDYIRGASAGWDAAIAYVKREAFRRLTGL